MHCNKCTPCNVVIKMIFHQYTEIEMLPTCIIAVLGSCKG